MAQQTSSQTWHHLLSKISFSLLVISPLIQQNEIVFTTSQLELEAGILLFQFFSRGKKVQEDVSSHDVATLKQFSTGSRSITDPNTFLSL